MGFLEFETMSPSSEFEECFEHCWEEISADGKDSIKTTEVKDSLDLMGFKLPNHKVRDLLEDFQSQGKLKMNDPVSKDMFKEICTTLKQNDTTVDWKTTKGFTDEEATTDKSQHGYSYHMILKEEQRAFSDWVNVNLGNQEDLKYILPLREDGEDLYEKISDGVLLCKIINFVVKDTIDPRVINKKKKLSVFQKHENLTLAIKSAQAIGCHVVNMDAHILHQGRKHIILGLIWQIIKHFLFEGITLQHVPGLLALCREGESAEELLKMSPEQILLRWVNFHLERAGSDKRVNNFSNDIRDSEAYSHLLSQISPKDAGVNKSALQITDLRQRADKMLQQAEKIECRAFVTAQDVVNGVEKLNLAFVANLFNNYAGLDDPEEVSEFIIEETREEKTYRNWMNSLGVDPYVNYLYGDLYDGLIIFQIYDIIKNGMVNWKKVTQKNQYSKIHAKKIIQIRDNCNYAVDLGRDLELVIVGVDGNDIMQGNKTLTLGLIWQLMRKYTLSLLAKLSPDGKPMAESQILSWANQKLAESDKNVVIYSFQDSSIKTALPIIHLIDALRPGTIDYSIVKSANSLDLEDCLSNAKYAIAMCRKIGAPIFALPEDITEMKNKMILTVYANLMLVDIS
ncbi:fimbrin isoform X2 [Lepeophtheirus salmonis]|uniref:Calponin-homology (CH) domain-containing protein n=1 Tax=Lepeophtheirus salmonis TaxID=72036 RepID=A0A0K2U1X2_LEPSM|nr:fimbrin-like isoform X2 [Lepeophtheirus salmonis]